MWLDSHCHVTADRFDADREDVLERARQAGVETLIAIGSGYGIEGSRAAVELARDREDIFATAGVHPHDADQLDDAGRSLQRQWLAEPKVMAVGECGLDYHYMNSPREAQRSVFAEQVALAREIDLPVSIHVRGDGPEAYDELLDAMWRPAPLGASVRMLSLSLIVVVQARFRIDRCRRACSIARRAPRRRLATAPCRPRRRRRPLQRNRCV